MKSTFFLCHLMCIFGIIYTQFYLVRIIFLTGMLETAHQSRKSGQSHFFQSRKRGRTILHHLNRLFTKRNKKKLPNVRANHWLRNKYIKLKHPFALLLAKHLQLNNKAVLCYANNQVTLSQVSFAFSAKVHTLCTRQGQLALFKQL